MAGVVSLIFLPLTVVFTFSTLSLSHALLST
jgi:hypothetical protein